MAVKAGRMAVYDPRVNKAGNVTVAAHEADVPHGSQCVWMADGSAVEVTLGPDFDFDHVEILPADGRPDGRVRIVKKKP